MSQPRDTRFLAALAGNLAELAVTDVDEGLTYLLDEAGRALRSENWTLAVCVRDSQGNSALAGWRSAWDLRHGPDSTAHGAALHAWYGDARNHHQDAMITALAGTAGATRAFRRRDVVEDDAWRRSPVRGLFDAIGVHDRIVAAVPVDRSTEVVLTSYRRGRDRPFSVQDRDFAEQIVTAAGYYCKRLALSLGMGEGLQRLTARERTVLLALLGGASEKEIAGELGLTPRSLHQVVVTVYRKLGTSSRPQLMARFLAGNGSPPPRLEASGHSGSH